MNSQHQKNLKLKKQLAKIKEENRIFKDNYEKFFLQLSRSASEKIVRHNTLYKRVHGYTLSNNGILIKIHKQMLKLENIDQTGQKSDIKNSVKLKQEIDKSIEKRLLLKKQYEIFNLEFKKWNEEISDKNDKLSAEINNLGKVLTEKKVAGQQSNNYKPSNTSLFWKKLTSAGSWKFNIGNSNKNEKTNLLNQSKPGSYYGIN